MYRLLCALALAVLPVTAFGQAFTLPAGGAYAYRFQTTTAPIVLTIDCGTPAHPDAVGPVFVISAPALGTSSEPRSGFWRWAGKLAAGVHSIQVNNRGQAAACRARVTAQPAGTTCSSRTEYHSPVTAHNHWPVGSNPSAGWESFPSSGNHWGIWAKWNVVYPKAIKRGYLLHNLEHGGLVLSYRCRSAAQSAKCSAAQQKLIDLARAFGRRRFLITPDPTQPAMYGIRGWRWAYLSNCLDMRSARAFMAAHHRHGREDEDSDPPPFDPTTTNAPPGM
jgi:hypothetical protein